MESRSLLCLPCGLVAVALALAGAPLLRAESDLPRRGMVASGHPLATQAGLNVLKSGGNAIDAAVAVGLTLGVVDGYNSGIGGGCFLLIRLANGKFVAIDGRETAPAAATRELFVREGRADTRLSQTGPLAVAVPGQLAAFDDALRRYGRRKLKQLILPAAELAETGFIVNADYAARVKAVADELARFDGSRAIFFQNDEPLRAGDCLRQPDLAATYRAIAAAGADWFYRGPFARAAERWMREHGGILRARDFADYRIVRRRPIQTTYRGHTIVTFPPPSSGGVHLAQMLNMLESFDLNALDEATRLHLIAETMKRAFADRAWWLGDPAFARVPRGLIAKAYARSLAGQIDLHRATPVPRHGQPPDWQRDVFPRHTTHFSVADANGNWVACTATINTTFGSKVVIPGTGVILNNEMDDFAIQPGVPNAFGLVGAEANAVAPGKRPLSSMTPTLVLRDGEPILALGAAGGPRIISTVLLELIAMLDLGQSPAQAVAAPRIHHQWLPDELVVEQTLPADLRNALEQRGHRVVVQEKLAVSQIVARTPDGSGFVGAADPRGYGTTAGW
ncbi:MAG: gamma-glutamyltransferase [Verrucomicrobiae bacterium]|nr:gamma-glutamyltransferase [Verrucomicrobiae bacterium]